MSDEEIVQFELELREDLERLAKEHDKDLQALLDRLRLEKQ